MVRVRQPGYRERDHECNAAHKTRLFRMHVYVRERRTQAARSRVSACRRTSTLSEFRLAQARACALRPIDRPARPARTSFRTPLISPILDSYRAKNPKFSILKNLRHSRIVMFTIRWLDALAPSALCRNRLPHSTLAKRLAMRSSCSLILQLH
ncbi:unnamed protein product [Euphydryas editha]|uniref:Uncharacterized protein n=1 Tax=Euphydryas editha TaxID=104508 RepID=A0AAU9UWA8_EUPED|nr:unnamed protein product [Euphydryas editha]